MNRQMNDFALKRTISYLVWWTKERKLTSRIHPTKKQVFPTFTNKCFSSPRWSSRRRWSFTTTISFPRRSSPSRAVVGSSTIVRSRCDKLYASNKYICTLTQFHTLSIKHDCAMPLAIPAPPAHIINTFIRVSRYLSKSNIPTKTKNREA